MLYTMKCTTIYNYIANKSLAKGEHSHWSRGDRFLCCGSAVYSVVPVFCSITRREKLMMN